MIAFDANFLVRFLVPALDEESPEECGPIHPRLNAFVEQIEKNNASILIPTPALTEVLVYAGREFDELVSLTERYAVLRLGEFGKRAAMELAIMTRAAIKAGDKRSGLKEPYQKIKVDRQVVAVAKVEGAKLLCTGDNTMAKFAREVGLDVMRPEDLPEPPSPPELPEPPAPEPESHILPLFPGRQQYRSVGARK